MNISSVSPEALVQSVLNDRQSNTHLQVQASLLKQAQATQSNAISELLGAIPVPQADGSLGNNVNLHV